MWSILYQCALSILLSLIIINASLPANDYSHLIKATATVATVTRTYPSSTPDSNSSNLPLISKYEPIHSPRATYDGLPPPPGLMIEREQYNELGFHCTTLPMQTPKPNAFLNPYIHS